MTKFQKVSQKIELLRTFPKSILSPLETMGLLGLKNILWLLEDTENICVVSLLQPLYVSKNDK